MVAELDQLFFPSQLRCHLVFFSSEMSCFFKADSDLFQIYYPNGMAKFPNRFIFETFSRYFHLFPIGPQSPSTIQELC